MQLKRIQLTGFKSFVDVTQIPILSKMNAIVGPNGCGKSNIVDAIRWVSGEMSAKQLRGQSMSDVIFNGTTGRKPVGKASVELVFDNTDGRISGEYTGFSEIAIRREVIRDAQSDYFINGVAARRKDLVDLFLGTGLGPRSYAIIEQGMITQLIEAKPEELRSHFEEVAGISKYRERRRETETRIRHTQDNLDRLNDLREELVKQLRHLKRQANAAEKYQELKREQRLINAQIKALQWQLYHLQLAEKNKKINQQALSAEAELTKQREIETAIEKLRLDSQRFADEKNEVQKQFYGLGSDIARLEQKIQHKQEQITEWKQELLQSEALFEELNENSNAQTNQIQKLMESVLELKPQENTLQNEFETANQNVQNADSRMQESQIAWDQFQEKAAQTNNAVDIAKNNIQHVELQIKNLIAKKEQCQKRLSECDIDTLSLEIQPLSDQTYSLKEKVNQVNLILESLSKQISAQRILCEKNQIELSSVHGELQKLEAQYASLDAVQQSKLKDQYTDALPWIKKYNLDGHLQLGKSIQVDSGWELAVETILGDYFDAICVDHFDSLYQTLDHFEQGQVTLLSNSPTKNHASSSEQSILSVIHTKVGLPEFLSHIFIAEDLNSALTMQANLKSSESVITRSGIWLGFNWIRVSNKNKTEKNFLMREKSLKKLQIEIENQKNILLEKENLLNKAKTDLKSLELNRDTEQQVYQKTNTALNEAQIALTKKQSHLDQFSQQKERLFLDIQQIHSEIERLEFDLKNTQESVLKLMITQETENNERANLLTKKANCSSELAAMRTDAQLKKQRADEWFIQLRSNENQLSVLKQTVASNQKQLIQLSERRAILNAQLSETQAPIENWTAELQSVLTQRISIESVLQKVDNQLRSHQELLKRQETERDHLVQLVSTLKETQQQLKMEQQEIVVRQATLKEQLLETDFVFDTLLSELPPEANLAEWEARGNQLQISIEHLGPINLAAIEEYKTIDERKIYLDQQYQDLVEALEILQGAIRKIDQETRHLFRETFDKVNEKFRQLFPRIFNGGQAELELTEDNILTTGITVKAQPPGKKNATIHLLSGGEKTLTAIALMFAMFQLNPAPFCVLDEVDAPLDDLNVRRFCNLVKEMSTEIQFLIISHNKTTIDSADHLMGVTMQEPGVSRIVSVDIQEAIALAEA